MANSLTVTPLVDGSKNLVLNIDGYFDTSNEAYTPLALPANFWGIDNSGNVKAAAFGLRGLQYNVQDVLIVELYWDGTTPILLDSYTGRGKYETTKFGPLYPPAASKAANGLTGGLGIATLGWATGAILTCSMTLELVKLGNF